MEKLNEQNEQPTGWEAATVDSSAVKRISQYEQGFRERRAEAKEHKFEQAKKETISVTTVRDANNPSKGAQQPVGRLEAIKEKLGMATENTKKTMAESGNRLDQIKQQLAAGRDIER